MQSRESDRRGKRLWRWLLAASLQAAVIAFQPALAAPFYSAIAGAGPTSPDCLGLEFFSGGSGSNTASTGSIFCTATTEYLVPISESTIVSSTASASGSWVTGDFFASAGASANPATFHGASINSVASVTFVDSGVITLPPGVVSEVVTFGATGVSGSAIGFGVAGFSSSDVLIQLQMIAGGSTDTSVACLNFNSFNSACGSDPFGLSGVGALAPVALTVINGESLQLNVTIQLSAFANAYTSIQTANAEISVDPLYLTLGNATFDSGISEFLSGSPPPPTSAPEPSALALFGAGLAGAVAMGRRKKQTA